MRSFVLERPTTLAGAVELLGRYRDAARPVSGGTALLPLWKQGALSPAVLVDLAGIPELRRREIAPGEIIVGAMTRLAELEDWGAARAGAPLLLAACRSAASRRIREMATIGGSLVHGESGSDVNAAALASDLELHLVGPGGARSVAIGDFFRGLYETAVGPDEIVTHVSCRPFPERRRSAYVKFSPRSRYDKPTLAVAVAFDVTPQGVCTDARVALGNVVERPVRSREAEQTLQSATLDEQLMDDVGAVAARALEPIGDLTGSSAYKRAMVRVFVRRALQHAVGGPGA